MLDRLNELLDKVNDEWDNASVTDFLESCIAWVEDTKDNPKFKHNDNPWKRCAIVLYAGKIYE